MSINLQYNNYNALRLNCGGLETTLNDSLKGVSCKTFNKQKANESYEFLFSRIKKTENYSESLKTSEASKLLRILFLCVIELAKLERHVYNQRSTSVLQRCSAKLVL